MSEAYFALTEGETVYHWYVPHAGGDDPLESLLVGKTKCGRRVTRVVGADEPGLLDAVLIGLYCGSCWRGTESAAVVEELRAQEALPR